MCGGIGRAVDIRYIMDRRRLAWKNLHVYVYDVLAVELYTVNYIMNPLHVFKSNGIIYGKDANSVDDVSRRVYFMYSGRSSGGSVYHRSWSEYSGLW